MKRRRDGEQGGHGGSTAVDRARTRLYESGASATDVEAYLRLLASDAHARPSSATADAEARFTNESPLTYSVEHESRPARRTSSVRRSTERVAVVLVAVGILGAAAVQFSSQPPVQPEVTPAPVRFELIDIPLAQRLTQYPASLPESWRGAVIATARDDLRGRDTLQIPARYDDERLLLVVRCPRADGSWRLSSTSPVTKQTQTTVGVCGAVDPRPIPNALTITIEVAGSEQFSAAILAR